MESNYSAISTPPQIVAANMNAAKGKTNQLFHNFVCVYACKVLIISKIPPPNFSERESFATYTTKLVKDY